MELFARQQPLAEEMRPQSLDDVIGQRHLNVKALEKMADQDQLVPIILWGPPGCGKTTIARCLAKLADRQLIEVSAVESGVKELRQHIANADTCLLFVDEIHHLNRSQQDILLPSLESGRLKMIGATTENPSFSVNKAILSRCLSYRLLPLSEAELRELMERVASKKQRQWSPEAQTVLLASSHGDARKLLNLMSAVLASSDTTTIDADEVLGLGVDQLMGSSDEDHYNLASAMIKSIRASHPDAAVYYMARMMEAGEPVEFIARRLVIAASEDVGNANPMALIMATSALEAVRRIGMPEARIILGQTATYLASSPKSNRSYLAVDSALADVKAFGVLEVPLHLRNGVTQAMKNIGYGQSYIYPHDDPQGAKAQKYLPEELGEKRYYEPSANGSEQHIQQYLHKWRPHR